ncbi:hypothetical protein [Nitriliruptor alkaliphilus]|uniref:hypothetical protein n=1 Tax=Nitriliruptor alkaliphilus TaxID=427918 RepID=UPI0006974F85|nr:hypothetical protein [Nitriliruptor alkaliphilus]
MPRRYRPTLSAVFAVALGTVLVGCAGGGSPIPDGYQRVEHPDLHLAVPQEWEPAEAERRSVDEDATAYRVPDADGLPIGLEVFRAAREGGSGYARADFAVDAVLSDLYTAESFEPLGVDHDVTVAGSDDAFLQQLRIAAPNLGPDATVRFTAVGVSLGADDDAGDGDVVVVLITGPEDRIDDATIERIVDSLEVVGA